MFCGAGGLSYGFAQAGFDIRLGVDLDAAALLTFERNHPDAKAVRENVAGLTGERLVQMAGGKNVLGIIGGPPCQGFSFAGHHDPNDPRNRLPYEYARLLREVQPVFFLMENVKGLLSKKQRVHFDAILALFSAAGYTLEWRLLNAWDYGIAQTRERVFIIGFRNDVSVTFRWPPLDPARPVLRDAIGDLPDPLIHDGGCLNHALFNPHPLSMQNRLKHAGKGNAMFDCKVQDWEQPCKTVTAHLAKDVDLAHLGVPAHQAPYPFLPDIGEAANAAHTRTVESYLHNHGPLPNESESILALISQADEHGVIPVSALQAVMPTRVPYLKGRQKAGAWHKPNPTVTAIAGFYAGAHYHPDHARPRRFTVREVARIQSFPDSFVFYGSLSAQYRQVGNAVPPKLVHALARQIAKALAGVTNTS